MDERLREIFSGLETAEENTEEPAGGGGQGTGDPEDGRAAFPASGTAQEDKGGGLRARLRFGAGYFIALRR